MSDIERLPPHSIEAEEAVLGSLLIDPDAIFEVAGFLKPEAFYRVHNRWVYDAIVSLNERHEAIDFITLTEELRRREQLEEVGELDEAVQVYRSLQLAYGPDADTCLRMGELMFRMGDHAAARERYYMAIEMDETLVEARAALGCVLAEMGHVELAVSALEGALIHHPDYADVHFQLARLFQSASKRQQAVRHWQRFLALSPGGPWADDARSQLEYLRGDDD